MPLPPLPSVRLLMDRKREGERGVEGMGKEGIGRDWDGLLRNDDHGVREMMLEGCKKLADEIESMRRAVDAGEMEPEDGGRGTGERAARIRCLSAYLAEVLDVLDARHDCNMALLSEAEADIEKLGERASNAQVEIASVRGLLSEDGTRPAGIDSGPFKSSLQRLEWQGASMRCEQGLGAARRRLDLLFARCSAWMSQGLAVRPGEEVPGGGVPTDGRGEEQGGHGVAEEWSTEGILLAEELALAMSSITAETAKSMEACKAASIVVQTRARADGSSSCSWAEAASDGRSALDEDLSRRRF